MMKGIPALCLCLVAASAAAAAVLPNVADNVDQQAPLNDRLKQLPPPPPPGPPPPGPPPPGPPPPPPPPPTGTPPTGTPPSPPPPGSPPPPPPPPTGTPPTGSPPSPPPPPPPPPPGSPPTGSPPPPPTGTPPTGSPPPPPPPPGPPPPPPPPPGPPPPRGCGGNLTAPNGVITSPGYPNPYPNSQLCTFNVKTGFSVTINCPTFGLQPANSKGVCSFDSLTITDNGKATAFCGTAGPKSRSTTTSNVSVVFKSDATVNQKGFSCTYSSIIPG